MFDLEFANDVLTPAAKRWDRSVPKALRAEAAAEKAAAFREGRRK